MQPKSFTCKTMLEKEYEDQKSLDGRRFVCTLTHSVKTNLHLSALVATRLWRPDCQMDDDRHDSMFIKLLSWQLMVVRGCKAQHALVLHKRVCTAPIKLTNKCKIIVRQTSQACHPH